MWIVDLIVCEISIAVNCVSGSWAEVKPTLRLALRAGSRKARDVGHPLKCRREELGRDGRGWMYRNSRLAALPIERARFPPPQAPARIGYILKRFRRSS